ncbi:oxidoreductase [Nocardia vulneris]|uniref:Oxidoreductase n=1 Tax=Nocardia vulneris TaxID=1141657 RepID=A0ABR4Z3G5_9NOCA|nr:oxidoreductase [Nocardia vulneris]KIA59846.1 oxidoreductase [Nocardia vulneris]
MADHKWTSTDLPSFAGRRVVVTGANSGLGLIVTRELARVGAHVVLAVRDVARGNEAARQIAGSTEVRALDLADLASVRRFAKEWTGDLDVLVNNAGIMLVPEGRTHDGFENQIGTNHLGHFALTNLLLPHVTDRVITVSSQAHRRGTVDLKDLNWETRKYSASGAYAQSKLANLLFTLELQRRLTAAGSRRAYSAHPGIAATNLQRHSGSLLTGALMHLGNRLLAQPAHTGALPILYAISQDLAPGSYVGRDGLFEYRGSPTLVGRSAEARDAEKALELWELSEQLTHVTCPLPH